MNQAPFSVFQNFKSAWENAFWVRGLPYTADESQSGMLGAGDSGAWGAFSAWVAPVPFRGLPRFAGD